LTAVLESSSEAREPPGLLLMLILLLERLGRIIALMGRWTAPAGEPGGEAITAGTQQCRCVEAGSCAVPAGGRVGVRCEQGEAEPVEDIVVLEGGSRSSCAMVQCWLGGAKAVDLAWDAPAREGGQRRVARGVAATSR
jgi:hypothetical protein